MKNKILTKRLLIYEIRNATGNVITIFFGVAFPLILSILFANVIGGQYPIEQQMDIRTSIFLSIISIIPMATMFIGYAATYSQEIENDIPLRLDLFGITKRAALIAKVIAYLIFTLASTGIYFAVDLPLIKIYTPSPAAVFFLILIVILLGVLLLVIAHSIAGLTGKFGRTYAVTMILYFGFMILCGMMGVQVSDFPPVVQTIAKLLPMTYLGTEDGFISYWKGESFNPTNFILSFVFLSAVAVVLFLTSVWKNRRK
ncbi:MAG: ABC transporter permease [Clostridiales bacterium]|jgi:ABC-2 type transport system permease protein|nr:ABC transporter permease [Clostridiales bacterium]